MSATAAARPATVTVGDPITVTVALEAPSGSTLALTNPPSTPLFSRLAVTPWTFRRTGSLWRIERTETWASFSPGRSQTFSYAYSVKTPAGPASRGAITTAPVAVRSVLPAGTASAPPAPLRPPITRTFVPWQLAVALLAGAVVAVLFASFLRRKRASSRARTADEVFEEELRLLETSLAGSAPEGPFYDWLAEITRWYVEQKIAVPAPRLTSSEIVAALAGRASDEAAGDFRTIFAVCDGYRFARREHRHDQAVSAIAAAREGARSLRAREEAPAEPDRKSA
jgi:hypothetical protein